MVLTPHIIEMPARSAAAAANLALVNRAKSGDRVAFSQLLENNYDFIFRTACKWTGKKSDAGDAMVLAHVLRTDIAAHRPTPNWHRRSPCWPARNKTRSGMTSVIAGG